jgi:AAA15 family ATPase/GTPase
VKIKNLHIKNYKSLEDVKINEPNPFTVFVGPNGSGKSNIFEALEFANTFHRDFLSLFDYFEEKTIYNFNNKNKNIYYECKFKQGFSFQFESLKEKNNGVKFNSIAGSPGTIRHETDIIRYLQELKQLNLLDYDGEIEQFIDNFGRIFINNKKLIKRNISSDTKLNVDASNLEKVLRRILKDPETNQEIIEWLQVFIPEFEKIEINESSLSGEPELAIYEKSTDQPFPKNLISDGTYNILSLLTSVYQNTNPQFLLIEEPENGLHPFVIKHLVSFFRNQCKEKGHYIWVNTHSQTLVSELTPEEIITVTKESGATKIKQHKGENIYDLTMDEAWLSNALGGGVPW